MIKLGNREVNKKFYYNKHKRNIFKQSKITQCKKDQLAPNHKNYKDKDLDNFKIQKKLNQEKIKESILANMD